MVDELIDIFDEENKFTGVKKMKSEAHKKGLCHRVIHVIVYNSKGELLIQLREKNKILYPNLWDISAAGHIGAGEESEVAAARELFEEVGISVKAENLEFQEIKKVNISNDLIKNKEFAYVYFVRFEGNIKDLKVQKKEVQAIRFISLNDLEEELRSFPERFCPYGAEWFDTIKKIRNKL